MKCSAALAPTVALATVLASFSATPAMAASIAGSEKCTQKSYGMECVTIDTNAMSGWEEHWSRFLENTIAPSIPLTCSETNTIGSSKAVSGSISAEMQAFVLGKIKYELGGSYQTSRADSSTSTAGPVSVPRGWRYTCEYGIGTYVTRGHTTIYYSSGQRVVKTWSIKLPQGKFGWKWVKVRA